jgi:hypothetical protein
MRAKSTEGKGENDDGEVGEKGGAGGVLRASGADTDSLGNKDGKDNDEDSEIGCCVGMVQGAGKKKSRGPPWWVGRSEYEKGLGSDFFLDFFYRVFELPSSRNAQKRDKTKFERKSVLDFWSNFL